MEQGCEKGGLRVGGTTADSADAWCGADAMEASHPSAEWSEPPPRVASASIEIAATSC